MKKIFAALIALVSSVAFSATLNPVQLLNPAGSSSGQAIVSTGSSSAPAWGNVTATALAAQAANTVVANVTGSSASPTAFAMPSCATALEWVSGTGFTCNSAGAFTTLSASGNDALLYQNTSAQSIPGSSTATTITGWTKVADRVNTNFNASTGVFTAPATGWYHVDARILWCSVTPGLGDQFNLQVVVNGTAVASGLTIANSTGTANYVSSVSATVSATSGQTIVVQGLKTSAGACALNPSAIGNYLSINRVP